MAWLTVDQYAAIAGISPQAARKRLRQTLAAQPNTPNIRLKSSRGGRSGRAYEVATSGLPAPLKTALIGSSETDKSIVPYADPAPRRVPAPNQSERVNYRWRVIEEAVEFPIRSSERVAEIQRAAKKWGQSVRTIQRWIRELETMGGDSMALARRKPADAGKARVVVTRRFDKAFLAAGYPADALHELSAHLDQLLQGLWSGPVQRSGWKRVGRDAATLFGRECRTRGFTLPASCFELSRYRIMQHERFREVDIFENDRKRWDDNKPRIRRDWTKLAPMEQIVMDVKPLDCTVVRPDGTVAWPKMIGFMDAGTHRLFAYFYLAPLHEAVRQENVIDAFLEMVADPNWGFPQSLLRDNGTEFACFDRIREALELINEPGARTIINAKPYQGSSKPIESKFATVDRAVFNQMGGWAGGDRMNKKTQRVGKEHQPYSGTWEEFVTEAKHRLTDFESWEIDSGPFKGKSPTQHYADKVDAGWRPVRIDPVALDAAFSKPDNKRVTGGAITIKGQRYRHPELINGERVTVALPYRRASQPVVKLPETGWAYLEPEMLHLPGDIAGAIEAGRIQARAEKKVRQMRKKVKRIDPLDAVNERVTALPTRAAPAPLIDIYLSAEAQSLGAAKREAEQRRLAAPSDAERERARQMRITERLEREQGRARP